MKKPLQIMLIIICVIIIVAGGSVSGYLWFKKHHKHAVVAQKTTTLTAAEAQALQVTLPQMTTNLKSSGMIQFTLTLQADNKKTKTEITQMQNQIQDKVNFIMRQFTPDDLKSDGGLNNLEAVISQQINKMLQSGRVTNVYLSQVLVQ